MKKKLVPPRNIPGRDEKYMGLAFWIASFSKDSTQMGAVLVGVGNRPLGYGYNGPPSKIDDKSINWDRPDKYKWIIHSEINAIDHSCGNLAGSTLYVTGKPCKMCMLKIVQHEISKVVYFPFVSSDKNSMFTNGDIGEETDEIARLGGVTLEKFSSNLNWMRDRIVEMRKIGVFG